jgi:Sec-independent protein translocase protein TatA
VFGLTFEKLLLIGVIAVFVLGPERLPGYAAKLAQLVRNVRDMANGAKERMRDEMGPEFDDVDWKKLDPRQYDPRRIIREALLDDEPTTPAVRPVSRTPGATRPEPAYLQHKAKSAGGPVPVEGAAAAAGAGAAAAVVGAASGSDASGGSAAPVLPDATGDVGGDTPTDAADAGSAAASETPRVYDSEAT